MFKKTIAFEDYDGKEVTKDFYFHLSKMEMLALATDHDSIQKRLEAAMASREARKIIAELRDFISRSCGVRTEDGRFLKDTDSQSYLLDSPAYDELVMELATDAKAAAQFINALMPPKILESLKKNVEGADIPTDVQLPDPFKETDKRTHSLPDHRPLWLKERRNPTDQEITEMSDTELRTFLKWQNENRT